jgi:hypothetical protein
MTEKLMMFVPSAALNELSTSTGPVLLTASRGLLLTGALHPSARQKWLLSMFHALKPAPQLLQLSFNER